MKVVLSVLAVVMALAMPAYAWEMGDDGLHKEDWLHVTFKDMTEDLATANAEGKRMAVIFEQRGCIYCTKMHQEVFVEPKIRELLSDKYFFVQMNLFGDEEVTDFDGKTLSEKAMARRWGVVFTPTILFMPEVAPTEDTAAQAAVMMMPGAFGKSTTFDMLTWVLAKGYDSEEHFQKYHARMIESRTDKSD